MDTLHPGRVVEVCDGLATVEVGTARLTALAWPNLPAEVLASGHGEEVVLQRDGGAPTSVRNALPARVVSVRPGSPLLCVERDAGFSLFAFVTRATCEELSLQPGVSVTALIKAPAVHLSARTI